MIITYSAGLKRQCALLEQILDAANRDRKLTLKRHKPKLEISVIII